MLVERIEGKWIDCFAEVFSLCGIQPGEVAAVLSETQSRRVNVELAKLALQRLGAQVFEVMLTTPPLAVPIPVRSTGSSDAIRRIGPVVSSLAQAGFVADLTVEGLMHAPELPDILQGGARVLYVSNEHPEILERLMPVPADEGVVKAAMKRLRGAKAMRVTSPRGTDLTVNLEGTRVGGVWGFTARPGTLSHWPGGIVLGFPAKGCVNGTLVMAPGDVNLTFKRYVDDEVTLRVENDYVTAIAGGGYDADLMRGYLDSWCGREGTRDAYAVSHVGWGLARGARWDALTFYDRRDCNATELRAFAGNFLFSTGANEVAGRHTLGHFDLPFRHCTVELDGTAVVRDGALVE